ATSTYSTRFFKKYKARYSLRLWKCSFACERPSSAHFSSFCNIHSLLSSLQRVFRDLDEKSLVVVMSAVNLRKPPQAISTSAFAVAKLKWPVVSYVENSGGDASYQRTIPKSLTSFHRNYILFPTPFHSLHSK